jgi:hypothetical protein
MGFLDWFKSAPSNVAVLDDLVWLTKKAKLNGIAKALSQTVAEQDGPDAVILVAHFQDCLDEMQRIAAKVRASELITVDKAETLERNSTNLTSFAESQTIEIMVGERHPLLSQDESVLQFARSLPCRCCLVHHVSLEDPLIRVFCGEWIATVLKKLGMADDEPIESNLVARQIKLAQKKIASQSFSESRADSAEVWMEQNCPEVWHKCQS